MLIEIRQSLTFAETGLWNQHIQVLSENLILTENIQVLSRQIIADRLIFNQRVTEVFGSSRTIPVIQSITFEQSNRTKNLELYQNVVLWDWAQAGPTIEHTLTFTEILSLYRQASQLLEFTESSSYLLIRNFHLNQALSFNDLGVYYQSNYYFIPPQIPTPTRAHTITILAGIYAITLPAPEIGEIDKVEKTRISRNTRNNDLIIFNDPSWPETQTLNYHFSFLSLDNIIALQAFIKGTVGQVLTIVDFEGGHWTGIITTPDFEYEKTGKKNYTANIELQGVRT